MPLDIIKSAGKMSAAYVDVGVILASISRPIDAATKPVVIRGLGPIFGSNCEATPAKTITPAENGKNAKPDFNDEYCKKLCR